MSYEKERELMVRHQIKARGITDKRVLKAMQDVPRHEFATGSLPEEAYSDYPLPIGEGQTISQPYIVALMTELLELQPTDRVLEVGTGSGYQAAILAEIAGEVITIERIIKLKKLSSSILGNYENLRLVQGDGSKGYEKFAPYDAIIVTAAAAKVPKQLVDQLKEGGRLVIPVGDFNHQKLLRLRKTGTSIEEEYISDVRFVPLVGDVPSSL